MKKKLLVGAFFAIVGYIAFFVDSPLQLILNFLIDGLVPGTAIQLGFIPSLLVATGLLFLVYKWIQDIRFEMIRQTALEMNAERVAAELNNSFKQEKSKRHQVVAAINALEQARY